MKFLGWAIALAAAGLTPVAAQAPTAAAPATVEASAPTAAAPATPTAPVVPEDVIPTPGIGMPDGRMGIQDQVTSIGHEAQAFHDNWLLWLCAIISLIVLGLLA